MAFSVVWLILGQAGPGEHFAFATVTAWKLLATGGVFGICWSGGRSVVAVQAVVVGWFGWILSDRLWAVEPAGSTPLMSAVATVVLWLLPLVLLRPNRRELFTPRLRASAYLSPMAVGAAVPLVIYSIRQGGLATAGLPEADAAYALTALGVVLAVQAVFAALRPSGSAWLPRFVALAAVWVGLGAIIWPNDLGSLGLTWGAALLAWGIAFAVCAEATQTTPRRRSGTDKGTRTTWFRSPARSKGTVSMKRSP
jgi:hypothetical protein